jgi:glutamate formiminotransferase
VFECVINISEGRDVAALDELAAAASNSLRDEGIRFIDEREDRTVMPGVGVHVAQ